MCTSTTTTTTISPAAASTRAWWHVLVGNNFFENALNPVFSQSSILGQWDLRNNNARSSADNARFNIRWTACSGSTPCQKATIGHDSDVSDRTTLRVHHLFARCLALYSVECRGLGQGPEGSRGCAERMRRRSYEQRLSTENGAMDATRSASSRAVRIWRTSTRGNSVNWPLSNLAALMWLSDPAVARV